MPGSAWIPWVLLALERALHLRTARAAALVGAAAALQLLAGSGDMALMTAGLAAARLALWLLRAPGPRRDRAAVAARIALAGGTCALALSAGAQSSIACFEVGQARFLPLPAGERSDCIVRYNPGEGLPRVRGA